MIAVTADFNYILPLIILIGVIASLIDKARKASEEAKRQNRSPQQRPRLDLPEATRRQIYGSGEQTIRRAKPLVVQIPVPPETEGRNDTGDGTNDEGNYAPPAPRRPQQPRPEAGTLIGELQRQIAQKARDLEQEARRQQEQLRRQRREAEAARQAPPRTEYERQEQLRRQKREAEAARLRETGPSRERPAAAQTPQPQPAPPRPAPAPKRAPRPRRRTHPLLGNATDIRRAIVLREVLGPPRGLE